MNRVAIITGASRGIGAAVAKGLAEDGYHVCLVSRNAEKLSEIALEIRKSGGSATAYPADLAHCEEIVRLRSEIEKEVSHCELLFNNAGIWCSGMFELSEETWKSLLSTNLTAPLIMMREFASLLKSGEKSAIVNLCSIGVKEGSAYTGAYGATKRGLLSISESAFKILAKDGIKVLALCPSWTSTPMAEQAGTPYSEDQMISTSDIVETIRWFQKLSPAVAIREIFLDCYADVR